MAESLDGLDMGTTWRRQSSASSGLEDHEKCQLLPRSSPFVGCLRHAPQQALAGQFDRLLRRRARAVNPEDSDEGYSNSSSSKQAFFPLTCSVGSAEPTEKLPSSSPYVGSQRHAPPSSPMLSFSGKCYPLLPRLVPPALGLPGAESADDCFFALMQAPVTESLSLPGGLPDEVWSSVVSLIIQVKDVGIYARVARGFRKVIEAEATWQDHVVRLAPRCLSAFAPHLQRWLPAWKETRKLVLPRSAQLLKEIARRAPRMNVEIAWRFDQHLKGNGVQVLKGGSTVRRVAEEELVVLGDAVLPSGPGRLPYLEVHLDECGDGIGDSLNDFGFGVTACDPEDIHELGAVADEVPLSWVVDFTQSMVCLSVNNREAFVGRRLTSSDLKQGTRLGLLVKSDELEVYVNGILRESLPLLPEERVPIGTGLFPVLDLYGRTVQISRTDAEAPCA
eukprot:CAMPEP_0115099890 /NCGR_PEP_ID=MMETSP0227-20121206/32170_1 /TAXON_ID=89957 /ORGANISM="Polarella glacialis, Strain CCMP 1383" /LENGTH=447 /DNA_ID=CAMNT_0002495065 /DNA_START=288 /DNA_END=1631 /DNA_ORIENTATION=-